MRFGWLEEGWWCAVLLWGVQASNLEQTRALDSSPTWRASDMTAVRAVLLTYSAPVREAMKSMVPSRPEALMCFFWGGKGECAVYW